MTFKLATIIHLFIPISIIVLFTSAQLISKRKNIQTLMIHFLSLFVLESLVIYFIDNEILRVILIIMTQFLAAYYCYASAHKKVYQIVIYSLVIQLISLVLTLIPLSFLYSITLQSTVYFDREFTVYAHMLFDSWYLALSYYYVIELSNLKSGISFFKYSTLLICQAILGYVIFLLSYDLTLWLFIIIMAGVISVIVITNNILFKAYKGIIMNYLYLFEEVRNNELLQNEKELKKVKRMIKQDINKVQTLLRRHHDLEAQDFIRDKFDHLKSMNIGRYSDNQIIDFVIYSKVETMRLKNISETIDIVMSKSNNIENMDIVTLLFNILDNAIEACEKIESKRFINIKIFEKYDCLYLEVINSKDPNIINTHLKTTKEDTLNHGIGISIIKNIVSKYKGDVLFEDNNETFRVKLFLKKN